MKLFKFTIKETTRELYLQDKEWIYIKTTPRCRATTHKSINPIPNWIGRIKYRWMMTTTWYTKTQYKRCQGCGIGISTWRITDPNYGCKNKFNCCDECVEFYGLKPNRKRIIGWKNGKEVVER